MPRSTLTGGSSEPLREISRELIPREKYKRGETHRADEIIIIAIIIGDSTMASVINYYAVSQINRGYMCARSDTFDSSVLVNNIEFN